jgi:ATP-dependent Clp protease ATP-binding subunit ClpB
MIMTAGTKRILDTTKRSEEGMELLQSFSRKIVGQTEATETIVNILEEYRAGFKDPSRPISNALFLGPTGTGKTRVVEVLAETLFGNPKHMIKIDCGEFQHSHEIAKLIGSPPGYLGHRETHARLTQETLNQWHTDKSPITLILFDEIEKSSDALWTLLLGILDKASLTLGTNHVVDFSKCIIIMTSNLGAKQMSEAVEGGMGFSPGQQSITKTRKELETIATEAMKKKFLPEFVNRIEHIVMFETLSEEQIKEILNIELMILQNRLTATAKVLFHFLLTPSAKRKLVEEGYNRAYGVRQLRRSIEKRVQLPLARLVSSGQINEGDGVVISYTDDSAEFQFAVHPELSINLKL